MQQNAPLAEQDLARALADAPHGETVAIPQFSITPPWHIRHARALACAAGLVVISGVAGAFYYVQQLRSDPVAKMRLPPGGNHLPAQEVSVPVPPPAQRTPSVSLSADKVALPDPGQVTRSTAVRASAETVAERRPANPPQQPVARAGQLETARANAPRMALSVRSSPVPDALTGAAAVPGASPAAASEPTQTSAVPAVTHTRRSEPASAARANQPDAPRRGDCTEAAKVLGLCEGK